MFFMSTWWVDCKKTQQNWCKVIHIPIIINTFFCWFIYLFLDSLSILSTGTIKLDFSCFSYADLFVLLLSENLSFTCISFLSSSHLNIFCSFSNFKDYPFVSPFIFGIFSLANPFLDSNVRVMLSPLLRFFNVNACSFVKIALVL